MYQATTPTLTLTFPSDSVDLTTLGDCLVSVVQGDSEIKISDAVVAAHSITFSLTQAQTAGLSCGSAMVQANFTKTDGSRVCSNIVKATVSVNLHNEVIVNV